MTNVWSKQAKRNYFHYRLLDKLLAYIHSVFKLTFACLLVFLKMSWNLQEKLPSLLLCKIPVLVLFIWNIFVLTLVISLTLNIWLSQNVCFLSGLTCLLMSSSPFYLFWKWFVSPMLCGRYCFVTVNRLLFVFCLTFFSGPKCLITNVIFRIQSCFHWAAVFS